MTRRGMTLIEILIAAMIMAIAAIGIYQLFFSGIREGAVGIWHSKSTTELRGGLRQVREDLARASYPSVVNGGSTDITKSAAGEVGVRRGETQLQKGQSGTLLTWKICKPAIAAMGVNRPGEEADCELSYEDTSIRYRRSAMGPIDKVIIYDAAYVKIGTKNATGDADKNLVVLTVRTRHPHYNQTTITETMEAKVEVAIHDL